MRLVNVVVVGKNRHVQDVALWSGPRNGRGDFTSGLINLDGPLTALIFDGVLGLTFLEGVALRRLIARVTTQAALWNLRLESDLGAWLIGHRAVGRDLDVNDRLELGLDFVRGLVRVGCLHLRGDDGARRHGVVGLRSDLAGLIDSDSPAFRNGGLIDLELSRVNRLVALHDGFRAHLGGQLVANRALRQTRAYEVGDLGVVRVNNDEQFKLVSGAVGVLHCNNRAREGARTRILRGGDGDVVVLVHLHGPALVDVPLVEGDLSFEAAVALLLCQFLNQVSGLGEGDLLRLGRNRAGSAIDAGDDRSLGLVVLRGVVLRVIQGEGLRVDDVRLVVASQRIRAVEDFAFAIEIVVLVSSLELVHGTWLSQNGEAHVLVSGQVGTAILGPGEVDLAGLFVDTQVLRTAGRCRVGGADELTVAVVGLHDHARHRIVRAFALDSRNVDLTDLGFHTRDDNVLLERLPRHRDRVTFDVLARPRVYDSAESSTVTLRGIRSGRVPFLVVTLPTVTHRVIGSGRGELFDFLLGQLCIDINVSLADGRSNLNVLVSLVGDVLVKEGLTDFHGGQLAGIQNAAK